MRKNHNCRTKPDVTSGSRQPMQKSEIRIFGDGIGRFSEIDRLAGNYNSSHSYESTQLIEKRPPLLNESYDSDDIDE